MIVDLVSAARQANWENARDLLYRHWGSECPKLYAPNPDHPWEIAQDDKDISELRLFLTHFFFWNGRLKY